MPTAKLLASWGPGVDPMSCRSKDLPAGSCLPFEISGQHGRGKTGGKITALSRQRRDWVYI